MSKSLKWIFLVAGILALFVFWKVMGKGSKTEKVAIEKVTASFHQRKNLSGERN
jgi:hypothetical protein